MMFRTIRIAHLSKLTVSLFSCLGIMGCASPTGSIFVNAALVIADSSEELGAIIAIDPETGAWRRLGEIGNGVRASPDGKALAFLPGHIKVDEIWISDSQSGTPMGRLSPGGLPVWSSDGKYILTTDDEVTWIMAADGSDQEKIPIPATDRIVDCSLDGEWVLTASYGQIYAMHHDGTKRRPLTKDGVNFGARVSPDGSRVVYIHYDPEGRSVRTVQIDATNSRTLIQGSEDSGHPEAVCWSPDGKQLAVVLANRTEDKNGRFIPAPWLANYRIAIFDDEGAILRGLDIENCVPIFFGSPDWR